MEVAVPMTRRVYFFHVILEILYTEDVVDTPVIYRSKNRCW